MDYSEPAGDTIELFNRTPQRCFCARTELCHRHYEVAAALLARAHDESPSKTRAIVMLEQSRLHELQGNVAAARALGEVPAVRRVLITQVV